MAWARPVFKPAYHRSPSSHKKADPYYNSRAWRDLRQQALQRDGYRCQAIVNGSQCHNEAVIANHVIARPSGPDVLENLISLCRGCDNRWHAEKGGHHHQY